MPSLRTLFAALVALAGGPALADLTLEGPLTQGGLVVGRADPGSHIELDGAPIRVSPEGIFLLGFHRDHPAESRLRVTGAGGAKEEQLLKIEPRTFEIERIDGLPQGKVTPDPDEEARIKRDNELLAQARTRDDPRTDFLSGWGWPVEGRISGVYGSQRILNGEPRNPHYGIDIAAAEGTPVRAPADGVVTLVHPDMFYSGGTLLIDHGHKLTSSFLHLYRILVKEGERVKRGDLIAEVGQTGRVTGPHLDWRITWRDARVDPQLLVPPMPAEVAKNESESVP